MQWNFWLTPRWSVFAEPGLYIYHGAWISSPRGSEAHPRVSQSMNETPNDTVG